MALVDYNLKALPLEPTCSTLRHEYVITGGVQVRLHVFTKAYFTSYSGDIRFQHQLEHRPTLPTFFMVLLAPSRHRPVGPSN